MEAYNTRVLKEPRGMIRAIQLVFAILAFATTSGFDTEASFLVGCQHWQQELTIQYTIEYPFKFGGHAYAPPTNTCSSETPIKPTVVDMEFATSPQFFVATGVLSFLYTIAALVVYIFGARHYETNPLIPVIDLVGSGVLTIFWLAGSCAWAAGVSDVKHYTIPEQFMQNFVFCRKDNEWGIDCIDNKVGKYVTLTISLIFGFANIFLWAASLWFVYKETTFHRQPLPGQTMGAAGGPPPPIGAGYGGYGGGDQMRAHQQQMPPSQQPQAHFPQQKQFADGY